MEARMADCRVWWCRAAAGRSRVELDLRLPEIRTARKARDARRERLAGGLCDHHALILAKCAHGILGLRSFLVTPE
jgi:hypothetical protein